jgi:hypothetical protein
MMMLGMAVVGMIALQFTKEKHTMDVKWDKIAQFIAFLFVLSIFRISAFSFLVDMGLMKQLPTVPPEIAGSRWTLCLVFWEDMFFGLPLYFIHKYMHGPVSKHLKWPLTILISMLFASGHAYQGLYGVLVTSIYPFFISKRYGEKHGFGTVMLCHILYDNFTFYSIWLLPYLLL